MGSIELNLEDDTLIRLNFPPFHKFHSTNFFGTENHSLFLEAERQLTDYFSGDRTSFSLPFSLGGTAFQEKVWQALMEIPYGERATYGEIAKWVGSEKAVRAVGSAIGKNPLPILLPCHRVIQKSGRIGGYSGGVERKIWLLQLEQGNKKSI